MNIFRLSLDLDKTPDVPDWVTLRQGDKSGTVIIATIYDHGTQLVGSYNARVVIGNPDGEHYYRQNATYNAGVATVTVDEQTAASVAGTTVGYFEILQGSTVIASTASFGVRILPSALDGAEPGEVYDSAIQDAIDGLNEAVAELPDTVEGILEEHPEWTTTVQDGSITDAKLVQSGGILDRVERLTLGLGNLLTATPAEADSLTVTDAAKTPLAGLALYGRSTQDGTPTPSAPVPIVSVGGANLFNLTRQVDGTNVFTANMTDVSVEDELLTFTAATANPYYGSNQSAGAAYSNQVGTLVPVDGLVSCTIVCTNTQFNQFVITRYGADKVALGSSTYTAAGGAYTYAIPSGVSYIVVRIGLNNATVGSTYSTRVAIYAGSTAYPYVPYGCAGVLARGRNLIVISAATTTASGIVFEFGDGPSVHLSGTATAEIGHASTTFELPAGTFTLSGKTTDVKALNVYGRPTSGGSPRLIASQSTASAVTFTISEPMAAYIYPIIESGRTVNATIYPMLEVGSTATPYQPYAESVTPIDLDGHELRSLPDGTRDEVTVDEWGHAVLTQRVGSVDLGTLTWFYEADNRRFGSSILPNAFSSMSRTEVVCDSYVYASSGTADNTAFLYNRFIYVYDSDYTDAAAFKASVSGAELIYPLATPVTIDLGTIDPVALQGPDMTAQAVPTAPFALTYERDLNIIIGGIYAQLAPVDGPTATSNHGVGTYLMLGGTLCKVTTAIAAGETIAIGTNVVATTVMAEILALTA